MLVKIALEAVTVTLRDEPKRPFHLPLLTQHLVPLHRPHVVEVEVDGQSWSPSTKEQIERGSPLESQALPEERMTPHLIEDTAEAENLFKRVGPKPGVPREPPEVLRAKRRHAQSLAPSDLAR